MAIQTLVSKLVPNLVSLTINLYKMHEEAKNFFTILFLFTSFYLSTLKSTIFNIDFYSNNNYIDLFYLKR